MIGHGRPTTDLITRARIAGRGRVGITLLSSLLPVLAVLAGATSVSAETVTVRLRFAWGSDATSPQQWLGTIAAPGAKITELTPIGIEADEAAAVRLVENQIVIAPLVRRAFDGCDVTVFGDEACKVTVQLRNSSATDAKEVEVALGDLAKEQFRAPLDDLGGYLLVQRAPGDQLRVAINRKHLVFNPDESISMSLTADLKAEAAASALTIEARLYRVGGDGEALWEQSLPVDPQSRTPLALDLKAPAAEGAYRLSLAARRPAGFADKFVPWEHSAPVASRDVEFVVIDPQAKLPRLADKWEVVATIDAANPRWWQRVPQWTQLDRLPGLSSPRPIGNNRPAVGSGEFATYIELPSPRIGEEPAWHAYPLAVPTADEPYAIEVELPHNASQRMSVSILEPDAAGRMLTFGRDCGVYGDNRFAGPDDSKAPADVQRLVFWPRTTSPLLLLANPSESQAAHYGKIRIVRRLVEPAAVENSDQPASDLPAKKPERLVAAYISTPRLAECLGAAEQLDAAGGLSVDGWNVFLTAAGRLAQELDAAGYNAAIVSVAANGSSLAPIDALGASPKYDTGPLSGAGSDPLRKDVLEALLRVFDREGLALVPAVELATPLGPLESLRERDGARAAGVECIDADGRSWRERYPSEAATGPHYNILNPDVQAAFGQVVDQLVERYGEHPSLAGLALQLSGAGYGVSPGLDWGLDDATVGRFGADAGVDVSKPTANAAVARTGIAKLPQWNQWRRQQLTEFYAGLAQRVRIQGTDRQLVLCTEDLFTGPAAELRLRQSISGEATVNDAAAELGVDLAELAATEGISLLRPRRLGPEESLRQRATALQTNNAVEFDQAVADRPRSGELFFHNAERLRLASFDAQSPYGKDTTYLLLSSPCVPLGDVARRPLAAALARRDFTLLAEGAELLPLALEGDAAAGRSVFRELPGAGAEVRTERHEPVTLRIYREADATTLCLINESPWPAKCELPLEADAATAWRQLGAPEPAPADPAEPADSQATTTGSWPTGVQTWTVTLPPYGIEARRFASRNLRVGALVPKVDDGSAAMLAARIAEIEQRMRNLDVERPYNELSNPEFELTGADGRTVGWQPMVGRQGAVEVDKTVQCMGQYSLRLWSQDAVGVAARSHLFPTPATGQLVIRAQVRAQGLAPDAVLYAWVEYEDSGAMRQQHGALGPAGKLGADWTACEFAVTNLPSAETGKMRIHFHLAGQGEAWVDNVQLFDLQFPDPQRVALGKWLYAARTALDSGQLVECQRLVEGYWPRYLLEHVPPPMLAIRPEAPAATNEAPAAAGKQEGSPSFGDRMRKLAPTKWR